ncbi:hypothetical protein L226DRAFT_573625 [Lentinus tigrinus ALCF2SS1-7]|uniref:DUF1996 domain-containing protein n=1 Tax=Lentinus tigrinus ALCF2SS1-6 TaxID=1328759 RepID=A0A5C2S2L8_9APHY|nr:hypothetical protein L227DRAFT_613374 [Lentinus tigrinus ALCF2SS1-6]RPD71965.1 hypothetical protein L226DRAFT_573625 [Lentinus tigrinus ALCF2SS1-7]
MVAGDPFLRTYNESIDDSAFGNSPQTHNSPTTPCPGGIHSQFNSPTCCDGKNVDSPNHRDHVAYAINASIRNFGNGCPCDAPRHAPAPLRRDILGHQPVQLLLGKRKGALRVGHE